MVFGQNMFILPKESISSGKQYVLIINKNIYISHCRYLVDGVFQHDPLYPTECDKNGNINNVITIGDTEDDAKNESSLTELPKQQEDSSILNSEASSTVDKKATDEVTVKDLTETSADLSSEYADDAHSGVNKEASVPDNNIETDRDNTQEPGEKAEIVADRYNSLNVTSSGQGNNVFSN